MRSLLPVLTACTLVVAACGSFGEETAATVDGGGDGGAGVVDGAASDATVSDPDASAGDGAPGSCTPLPPWSLDFSAPLPAEYVLPGNNNVTISTTDGRFTADATIIDSGQYRGRFQRDLDVPSGVDHLELAYTLTAGATPPQTTFELGCTLYLKPVLSNPGADRRLILRAGPLDLSYQWNGDAPSSLSLLGAPSAMPIKLTLQADATGEKFAGTLDVGATRHTADLDLGATAKVLRLECGLVAGIATASDAGARSYSTSVDDVSLSVCARP